MSRGGKREGAGRKALVANKISSNIKLSPETRVIIERYSQGLGLNKSDFIDRFLFLYVESCPDIIKCPHCGSPMKWDSVGINPLNVKNVAKINKKPVQR